jgi:hypothetical protein
MENVIVSSIREQRELGDMQNSEDFRTELAKMKPANMQESLPRSQYLKVKKTGEIIPWCEQFASFPDLVDCCDADGNIIRIPGSGTPRPTASIQPKQETAAVSDLVSSVLQDNL